MKLILKITIIMSLIICLFGCSSTKDNANSTKNNENNKNVYSDEYRLFAEKFLNDEKYKFHHSWSSNGQQINVVSNKNVGDTIVREKNIQYGQSYEKYEITKFEIRAAANEDNDGSKTLNGFNIYLTIKYIDGKDICYPHIATKLSKFKLNGELIEIDTDVDRYSKKIHLEDSLDVILKPRLNSKIRDTDIDDNNRTYYIEIF